MINICIVHYNTPDLTSALIKSINKTTKNCFIYLFDNSDKNKFINTFDNVKIIDNTKGGIINFENELSKYPNRMQSWGRCSNFGSFKHCISVQKCFDIINEPFILMDSDILLKKDITELYDTSKICVGETKPWSWNISGVKDRIYPEHKRFLPFLCFINVTRCKELDITYYDDKHMDGLYNPDYIADSYDTGCWHYEQMYEKCKDELKEIKIDDYFVHYGGGSYRKGTGKSGLTKEEFLENFKNLYDDTEIKVNKKVIYTCITGNYDNLIEPKYVTGNWDYICYTDNLNLKSNIWKIRQIPEKLKLLSPQKQNRYIKTHPHEFFKYYNESIYVDGTIEILGNLNEFVNNNCSKYDICIAKHPSRNCLYVEESEVVRLGIDKKENTGEQIRRYREEGFPENFGLTQNNIIYRKHNSEYSIKIMAQWWDEIEYGSHRDQLSLMYVFWKNDFSGFNYLDKRICYSKFFNWHGHKTRKKINDTEKRLAILCHVFDYNIWDRYISERLKKLQFKFDLYISVTNNNNITVKNKILNDFPDATIEFVPNLGEDIRGFLKNLETIFNSNKEYDYILKIHTKRDETWREKLLDDLLNNNQKELLNKLNGLNDFVVSKKYYRTYETPITHNVEYLPELMSMCNCKSYTTNHFSGTMFWVNFKILEKYFKNSNIKNEYFDEPYAKSSTKQHSCEILFGCLALDSGNNIEFLTGDKFSYNETKEKKIILPVQKDKRTAIKRPIRVTKPFNPYHYY